MDVCSWPGKMRALRGNDKAGVTSASRRRHVGITSGRRIVTDQRMSGFLCLPDVCTWAMFIIRGDAHRASEGKP